jgi:UDP-glucose 4-epimerase
MLYEFGDKQEMDTKISGRKVLVTGGAGFIGSHLVDALIEQEACVTVVDDLSNGRIENVNRKARFVRASINDKKTMSECLVDSDFVFHLAADTATRETSMGFDDPFAEMTVNAKGSVSVLKCLMDCNPSADIIFTSSAAVYGEPKYTPVDEEHPAEPISPYGISKLASEKYLIAYFKEFGTKALVARVFNTYGPRQSRYVIYDIIKKLHTDSGQLELMGNGSIVRDYAYVSDTVDALILIAERGKYGEIYNIAGGNPISIENLAYLILKELKLAGKTEIRYTGASWKGDITRMIANINKIKQLGYQPKINLETGIKKTLNWLLQNNG